MTALYVRGGQKLQGKIDPSANKNAVLPVLCATLLSDAPIMLRNVPEITDVQRIHAFFGELGSTVEWDKQGKTLRIDHSTISPSAKATLPQAMRASIMMIPGLLARLGEARLEHEVKGCTLGAREIDPHVKVFEAFGATVSYEGKDIVFRKKQRGDGARMWLEYASVTTTENFIISALTANGSSQIVNAACEPHVQEMCTFLEKMGARIKGKGTSMVSVEGCEEFTSVDYTFVEDFHEIATFLALAAVTGGDISVRNTRPEDFMLIDRTFEKFGAHVEHADGWSRLNAPDQLVVQQNFTSHITTKVEAAPWPYIPADLLPIFIALGVKAKGQTMFWNKVYEGGLTWHTELSLFGAHTLLCDPHRLITFGGDTLRPATVTSPYIIRVAIAMLMIASSIDGESTILDADPIRRAHPDFVKNIDSLGVDVSWDD
ncbi:UDP-N-acetylglucosamine 1-carboxyvinyltransferase [Aurantiacibacter gangjinensis]|uniref:UDP-N-acetylglucosamine 1-carboxyvinyltransferase n=1 Tax=Aurantiacibacter gangjinensis TaxID=502682 RepID=A0A0G9MQQ8_9SPHN|nr:UDP-N-acetylglucosamine 1-carboxyvinyltransferase [Aurantiacibacter gangjinensis]APE28925.1 UDP-N-acetylglucosamine 1-carboxyvinyltransferase [Aurantiacibacter gangjinensis]KLE33050.1 UDP-N-acetylglucosamine 1-carboxyvinyltransferase [Aurantiacibacter gangjinensis]